MLNRLIKSLKGSEIKYGEIVFLFIVSLTPLLWLQGEEIVLGHDSGFRLDMPYYFKSLLYSWNPIHGFGADWSIFKGFLVAQFPETLFTVLTGSLHWGQLLTFIFWFFAMTISMYILVSSLFPQKKYWLFRIFSSIFYSYNFYILQAWFIAERAKFSLYAALPLGFLIIYKLFSKKLSILKGAIFFSILFFVFNGGGSSPLYGGVILTYLLTFLYLTIIEFTQRGIRGIFFSLKVLGVLLAVTFSLNAYWVLPQINLYLRNFEQILQASGGLSGILDWENIVSEYASFINLFRLQGIPAWFGGTHPYSRYFLTSPLLLFSSFLPFSIILFGIWLKDRLTRDDNEVKLQRLFFTILLFGGLFTTGSRSPFGSIYEFLAENLPGFVIFRSSFYKFAPAFWFSFIFLSGYFLNKILLRYRKGWTFSLLGGLFVLFLLFYHFPYFSGDFFRWNEPFSTKVEVPGYVYTTLDFINESLPKNSRILLLPKLDKDFRVDSYRWGYFSLDLLPRLGTDKSIVADDSSATRDIRELYAYLENREVDKFIELSKRLGINGFLWRDDVLYSDKTTSSRDFQHLEASLVSTSKVRKVFENGEWHLYTLEDEVNPLISAAPAVIRADPSAGNVVEVDQILGGSDLPVLYSDRVSGIFNKSEFLAHDILVARCSLCRPAEFEELISTVKYAANILPDSHLYPLLLYKEERLLKKFQNIPTQRVDVNLALANKRLSEILGLITKERKMVYSELSRKSIDRYILNMEDAILRLGSMSEIDRNYYTVKISAYLESQSRFLESLDSKEDVFGFEMYVELADFIREQKGRLLGTSWQTEFPLIQRYFITVGEAGEYKMVFYPETPPLEEVRIDGEIIKERASLNSGVHKLEIFYPDPENLLPITSAGETKAINLVSGQPLEYVSNLKINRTYLVEFKYRFETGGRPEFWIEGSGNSEKRKLNADGRWHDFGVIFFTSEDEPVTISFQVPGVNRTSSLQISDFGLNEYYVPKVLMVKEADTLLSTIPNVKYKRLSPILFEVEVTEAKAPFILVFSEKFDSGWRLIPRGQKLVPAASHVEVNGYANGWIIDTQEPLRAKIVYWPQVWFYLGLGISGATILVGITLLLSKKK